MSDASNQNIGPVDQLRPPKEVFTSEELYFHRREQLKKMLKDECPPETSLELYGLVAVRDDCEKPVWDLWIPDYERSRGEELHLDQWINAISVGGALTLNDIGQLFLSLSLQVDAKHGPDVDEGGDLGEQPTDGAGFY